MEQDYDRGRQRTLALAVLKVSVLAQERSF